MRKIIAFIMFVLVFESQGQKIKYIQFYNTNTLSKSVSRYSAIDFIDSRIDTSHIGYVENTAYDQYYLQIQNFTEDIKIFHQLTAASSGGIDTLIFNLKELKINRDNKQLTQGGDIIFKAACLLKRGSFAQFMSSIDTVVYVNSLFNFSKSVINETQDLITKYIIQNYKKSATDSLINVFELIHQHTLKKEALPLYNTIALVDGIYYDYNAFKNQRPDVVGFQSEYRKAKLKNVSIVQDGKAEIIKRKKIYAIVDKGQAYIAGAFEYHNLVFENKEFGFRGKTKLRVNKSNYTFDYPTVSIKINYLDGSFFIVPDVREKKKLPESNMWYKIEPEIGLVYGSEHIFGVGIQLNAGLNKTFSPIIGVQLGSIFGFTYSIGPTIGLKYKAVRIEASRTFLRTDGGRPFEVTNNIKLAVRYKQFMLKIGPSWLVKNNLDRDGLFLKYNNRPINIELKYIISEIE